MKERNASILLAAVIIARASSYYFIKLGMESMETFNLLSTRFFLATALLAIFFFKQLFPMTRSTFRHGFVLGILFFGVMAFEFKGLLSAEASTVAFLENTSIVLVPLILAVLSRTFPDRWSLVGVAITLVGVAFLTGRDGGINLSIGEIYALCSALCYAAVIIMTAKYAATDDTFQLGFLQVFWIFVYSTAATFLFETPHLPRTGVEWWVIVVLAVVCTGFGFTLQPVAQKYVSTQRAGMFCAFNPLCATIMGITLLGEVLTPYKIVGIVCILLGLFLSIWMENRKPRNRAAS